MEVLPRDAVVPAKMPLGLTPEILDAVDLRPASRNVFPEVDSLMVKAGGIEYFAATGCIGIEDRVESHLGLRNRR